MSDYFQLFLSHISSSIFIFHFMPIMDKNTKNVSILHKLYSDTATSETECSTGSCLTIQLLKIFINQLTLKDKFGEQRVI